MRPIPLLIALCLAGGCKDGDHNAIDCQTREASEKVGEARDEVRSAKKAVADETGEVARAAAEGKPPAAVVDQQQDVVRAADELAADQAKFGAARQEFLTSSQAQLDDLRRRIDEAQARWGAAGTDQIAWLRRDHDALARIRSRVVDDPQADSREVRQQFDAQVNTVEENLKALKPVR